MVDRPARKALLLVHARSAGARRFYARTIAELVADGYALVSTRAPELVAFRKLVR